jgi:hypothetical protein
VPRYIHHRGGNTDPPLGGCAQLDPAGVDGHNKRCAATALRRHKLTAIYAAAPRDDGGAAALLIFRMGGVIEVATALDLPLPAAGAFAVAALAGPLDLSRGPLEARPDLVGLDLGDRALVALGVSQLRWRSRPVTITRS